MQFDKDLYITTRQILTEGSADSGRAFDRAILTLSGGALVLSVTFVEKVVIDPNCLALLFISWVCFGLSIVGTLVSFLLNQQYVEEEISKLHKLFTIPGAQVDPKNKWRMRTKTSVLISLSLFIVGVGFLVAFTIANLSGKEKEKPIGSGQIFQIQDSSGN